MAHLAARTGYHKLVNRLNKVPQGAPPSKLLYEILKVLMSEKEASLVALVPIKPFTAGTAARAWKMSLADAQTALDELASRALLIDIEGRRDRYYVLPPPMAGFFEFSMMRLRGDVDQKLLASLYYQYITVEEDFIKALFTQGETQLGRVFVNEAGPLERERPPRPRLRKGQRGHPDGHPPRDRPLLLPAQDGACEPGLRRPARHLHDLQHDGGLARPPRLRPRRRRRRRPWRSSTRPGAATSSSSARTSGTGSASSATAAAAAARP